MSKLFLTFFLFGSLLTATSQSCNCFLLKETSGNVSIDKLVVDDNRVEVLNDPSVVAVVFSMGEGLNGDMVSKSRRGAMIIAQCKSGILKLKIRLVIGDEKPLPDINTVELAAYSIRVNVKGNNGYQKAFRIQNYLIIEEDSGPVIDMFGGKIPLASGDFSITTETKKAEKPSSLKGKVGLIKRHNWLFVPFTLPNGKTYDFVLDLAATSTVVSQSLLDNSIPIHKMEMVEYNAGIRSTNDATMQGATGVVGTDMFLGKAMLYPCKLGDIMLEEVNASILKEFPRELKKLGVLGIVGTDVLRRTSAIKITGMNGNGLAELELGSLFAVQGHTSYPISIVRDLLFVEGKIETVPIQFLLDTGSRSNILSDTFVTEHHFGFAKVGEIKTGGLDGRSSLNQIVQVPAIYLKGTKYIGHKFVVVDELSALQSIGLQEDSAILGMDFFNQFSTLFIDFESKLMYLI